MLIIHNEALLDLLKQHYTPADIQQLYAFLEAHNTLEFPALSTGLWPAAVLSSETRYTGYSNVWVRDNIHIAHAHAVFGKKAEAVKAVQSLMTYFSEHQRRFDDIIQGKADPKKPMNRPHIRFDGETLSENKGENWPHAQNDALGYFLWLYCDFVQRDWLEPTQAEVETLARFPMYFRAIQYWQDEDSGHWEETRKIEASSIGAVVAGLQAMRRLNMKPAFINHCCQYQGQLITTQLLDELIAQGAKALEQILPAECIQPDPAKRRRYDGALLFLVYPLQVVADPMADQIVTDVQNNLQRNHGICRYLGDSYWFANYKKLFSEERRTADFSDTVGARDEFLKPGEEAQWCIFDPTLSAIFGVRYQRTGRRQDLAQQVYYLNRSLGQITGFDSEFSPFKCPELYHLESGVYEPSDATPLLWTQANLAIALKLMEQSLTIT